MSLSDHLRPGALVWQEIVFVLGFVLGGLMREGLFYGLFCLVCLGWVVYAAVRLVLEG